MEAGTQRDLLRHGITGRNLIGCDNVVPKMSPVVNVRTDANFGFALPVHLGNVERRYGLEPARRDP